MFCIELLQLPWQGSCYMSRSRTCPFQQGGSSIGNGSRLVTPTRTPRICLTGTGYTYMERARGALLVGRMSHAVYFEKIERQSETTSRAVDNSVILAVHAKGPAVWALRNVRASRASCSFSGALLPNQTLKPARVTDQNIARKRSDRRAAQHCKPM